MTILMRGWALIVLLLLLLVLVGCGTAGVPASAIHAPSEAARTPEGAKPLPPPQITLTLPGEKTINGAGLHLIEQFEGYSRCAYWDPYGRVWTAGFGQTVGIYGGFCFANQAGAEANLKRSIVREYEWAVHRVSSTFGQHAVNALDSFAYNLGAGIFTGTLRAALSRHSYGEAGNIMLQYDHAGGVVLQGLRTRRELEVRVLRTPDPPGPTPAKPSSRRHLEQRIRVLRADLTRRHCRTIHGRRAYPLCPLWAREGQQAHRELNRLKR